ncbi:MAG: hypothetical protein HUN04_12530 [Desulfobacter sp.]|nr:MAG: hypothetical protein HUN04_12530 [Desulfobacter sp.]
MSIKAQTDLERSYKAKVEALERTLKSFDNYSMVELWARMDLADDEIMYLSALEIQNEENNMEWEGFGSYNENERESLIKDRFVQNKFLIRDEKQKITLD